MDKVPGKIWYKIYGDFKSYSGPVLVTLHGAPGAGYDYLFPLINIYKQYNISGRRALYTVTVIWTRRSIYFRDKISNTMFWTFDLFIQELDNLVNYSKLNWGGMLSSAYTAFKPQGLKNLILLGAPASIPFLVKSSQDLLAVLPEPARLILKKCENGPDDHMLAFRNLKDDPAVYMAMQGSSEFGWQNAHKIKVEMILLNGRYDEATDQCVKPWFTHIPKVR
ncbi:Alpha/Beta hydrolase protein [Xylaria scruposa]|nr:Alpha/Beta hydrolase protein [Xylaria scruposa]